MEVPNFQNWTEGLYLVDAPCGTGKSYFVFHTLYPFAKENNKKLIVFSNRNALKRQQELQAEGTDIELITYQKLEYNQYLNGDWNVRRSVPDLMQELEGYDYIVLDEAHLSVSGCKVQPQYRSNLEHDREIQAFKSHYHAFRNTGFVEVILWRQD